MSKKAGKFEVIAVTKFSDLKKGDLMLKSDLALQNEQEVYQFKYHAEKVKPKKIKIKPGIWTIKSTQNGLKLAEVELGKKRLLLEATSSKALINEANRFFSNLHVYKELDQQMKRGVLFYSKPGMGKSSSISHFCLEARKEDPGTVAVIWPTSSISADDVCDFLSTEIDYSKKCTRFILVLEDIGGSEHENHGQARGVDSGLLSLLDGVAVSFKLPTFIIATTNHPESLLESLVDRPGRFDLTVGLEAPKYVERIAMLEFIAKRALSDEEKKPFEDPRCDGLSYADLNELIIRPLLHNKTMQEVLKELLDHKTLVKNSFESKKGKFGFGQDD